MQNFTLKVIEKRQETIDTVTLCFKQPLLKKVKYLAGQYLTLIFRINGRKYVRPYSFSSSPLDQTLEVTVKRIQNGIVSNHINDAVNVGDMIETMPPMGDFIYQPNGSIKNIYLWGVGSGITPLISLARSILYSEPDKKVILVYGNRTAENTIFLNRLELLAIEFKDRFYIKHFHTRLSIDPQNTTVIEGRIDESKARSILAQDLDVSNSSHYICGPKGLKESVKQALLHYNIDSSQVFSEEFELIKDPKDFADIYTQKVKLKFQQQEIDLEIVKGKSILEAALDANIDLPYSCQTGNCSTCKGNLIKGRVKMIGIKERTDLQDSEYLLCCSHPLTEDVYIEI